MLEGSESMTFRYISKVIENNKIQSEKLTRIFENTAKELGINYGNYKKLKDEIYYLDKKVDSADFESFTIYKSNVHSTMVFSDYAKDKNSIFYEGKIWKEPDYNSFQFLGESYAKDKANIYYSGKKINGADIDTFEIINWAYAKDKKYVYLKGEILKGKNPAKFKL